MPDSAEANAPTTPHRPPSINEAAQAAEFMHETKVGMEKVLALLEDLVASQAVLTDVVDSLSQELTELSDRGDGARDGARRPTPLHGQRGLDGQPPCADAA
jgi:hypothetical protein